MLRAEIYKQVICTIEDWSVQRHLQKDRIVVYVSKYPARLIF